MPLYLWLTIKFIALIILTYELFFIITNQNKKLSIIGTIILSFSGVVQWNLTDIDSLIIGEFITVLTYTFFQKEKLWHKVLISFFIVLGAICYTFTFRPYAVAFGYLFLSLILWIILKNKEKLKNVKEITLAILSIIISIIAMIIAIVFFNNNNVEYLSTNLSTASLLFSYLYSIFLPYYNFEGREILSSVICIFPLPMIVGLYYMYKKEEHIEFLLPVLTITVLETVFCMSGFPEIISKITFFSQVNPVRVVESVQIANLFIMLYFLGNVKEQIFKFKNTIRATILCACLLIFIKFPYIFSEKIFIYIFAAEISLFTILFLNFTDKKYRKVLLFFLVLITLISGVPVVFLN